MSTDLPEPGTIYYMQLRNDLYGACRVLRYDEARKNVVVQTSAWIGHEPPDIERDRAALCKPLVLTHHAWDGKLDLVHINEPVPESYILLGHIPPSEQDQSAPCTSYATWRCHNQALLQWRWDNEHEAVLAEDRAAEDKKRRQKEKAQAEHEEYLNNLTLEALQGKQPFAAWKGFRSDEQIKASHEAIDATIERLRALGANPPREAVLAAIKWGVERFNEIDTTKGYYIETIEREAIADQFFLMAWVCGVRNIDDVTGEWRDW